MHNFAYQITKGWLYLLSLLPFWALYGLSNVLAFILYRIIGYRKAVVRENLKNAFPEKSEQEIERITHAFYLNFTDVMFEFVKLMSIRPEELKRRVKPENPEAIPQMVAHGGGSVVIFSHYCNWEWLGAGIGLYLPFPTFGIYKPLKSPVAERLTLFIRNRLANTMIPQKQAYRESLKLLQKPSCIAFLGDQNPAPGTKMYFSPFFGRPVPAHLGMAKIALKLECPVWYYDIQRVSRGFYAVKFIELPSREFLPGTPENIRKFTDLQLNTLENIIRENPANWLWSHRRWKYKKPVQG